MNESYKFNDFLPLIIIVSIVLVLTAIASFYYQATSMEAMNYFMGFFFLVFGLLKVINIHGFVQAYKMYDIIAQRSTAYAYLYPFIELFLGLAYLTQTAPVTTNIITLIVMLVSAVGVVNQLLKKQMIVCACLGAVFKIPMTWVTLAEDLLMAVMALVMLLFGT